MCKLATYRVWIVTLLMLTLRPAMAQSDVLAKADKLYANGVYPDAAALYLGYLQQQYDYMVNQRLADCYYQMEDWRNAEHWYGVITSHNIADAGTLLRYAHLLKINGKYQSAKATYLKYAAYRQAGFYLASTCDWAMANRNKPSMYSIEPVSFNTSGSDMTPTLYRKGVIFARSSGDRVNPSTGLPYYDLQYAEARVDGSWNVNPLQHVNANLHEAAPYYDQQSKLLFFTRSNQYNDRTVVSSDGQVKLELFYSALVDGKFSRPRPLNINDPSYSIGHPTVTPDGTILIFASDMPGGEGGIDLYYSLKEGSSWSEPKNMGAVINSPGDEMYPYVTNEGILYFASNYHEGFGGYDVFRSERELDHWSKPQNLGMPVNSPQDDYGFAMRNGLGYFTSNRPGGQGSDDIYQVTLLAPIATVYVYDTDQKPVYRARVTFVESPNMQVIAETDVNGLGDVSTLSGGSASIRISKEGYLDKIINDIGSLRSSNGILPVELQPLLGTNE